MKRRELLQELHYACVSDDDLFAKTVTIEVKVTSSKSDRVVYKNRIAFEILVKLNPDDEIESCYMQPCKKFRLSFPQDFEALEKISNIYISDTQALLNIRTHEQEQEQENNVIIDA